MLNKQEQTPFGSFNYNGAWIQIRNKNSDMFKIWDGEVEGRTGSDW